MLAHSSQSIHNEFLFNFNVIILNGNLFNDREGAKNEQNNNTNRNNDDDNNKNKMIITVIIMQVNIYIV